MMVVINWKRKEYNPEGKLIFEVEYLNGKINGKVKKYYEDGDLQLKENF